MAFKEHVINVTTLKFVPCHRKAERSIFIKGKQFPICSRCMAILAGYFAIPFLLWYNIELPLYIGILLNVPMLVDGITQQKKWRTSNNVLRIVTGLLSGFGQASIVVTVAMYLVYLLLKIS